MLILSRKVDEVIRIGTDITITVTRIGGSQVSLGIDAPREVPVHRDEVYRAIETSEGCIRPGKRRPGSPQLERLATPADGDAA